MANAGQNVGRRLAEEIRCCDTAEGAALGLLGLMTGISEEYYCAGWIDGLQYALWQVEPGTGYGQGEISERQATLLRLLHEECGGWWGRSDESPQFFTTDDWLQHIADRPANGGGS